MDLFYLLAEFGGNCMSHTGTMEESLSFICLLITLSTPLDNRS